MSPQRLTDFVAALYTASLKTTAPDFNYWALRQLNQLIAFDAALIGSGNLQAGRYHAVQTLGLPDDYSSWLESSVQDSLLLPHLIQNRGRAVNSADVVPDDDFYSADFYRKVWQPAGIQRVLALGDQDCTNGLYSHTALYRRDRHSPFSSNDAETLSLIAPHIRRAISHHFFLHAQQILKAEQSWSTAALCDRYGIIHDVAPAFEDVVSDTFADWKGPVLPAELGAAVREESAECKVGELIVSVSTYAELRILLLRRRRKTDALSAREKEVVDGITMGLSYKAIASKLGISASTVSTLLCRAYLKLGVHGRQELIRLFSDHQQATDSAMARTG